MKKLLSAALCLICLFSFCLTGLAETAEADYLSQIPGTYARCSCPYRGRSAERPPWEYRRQTAPSTAFQTG